MSCKKNDYIIEDTNIEKKHVGLKGEFEWTADEFANERVCCCFWRHLEPKSVEQL